MELELRKCEMFNRLKNLYKERITMKYPLKLVLTIAIIALMSVSLNVQTSEVDSYQDIELQSFQDEASYDANEPMYYLMEQNAILHGNGVLWKASYKDVYNIKKPLYMSASPHDKSYTNIRITNKGKETITVTVYAHEFFGSNEIASGKIPAHASQSYRVTSDDVRRYGRPSPGWTRVTLAYVVSAFNSEGNKISFSAEAIEYRK